VVIGAGSCHCRLPSRSRATTDDNDRHLERAGDQVVGSCRSAMTVERSQAERRLAGMTASFNDRLDRLRFLLLALDHLLEAT